MKSLPTLLLTALCATAVGGTCRKAPPPISPPPAATPQDPHIVKLWVTKDGVIELNGNPADLATVDSALASIAKRDGVVFYGRDAAGEHPHPNGVKLVELIAAHHLPVRLSSKPDFSDAITPHQ